MNVRVCPVAIWEPSPCSCVHCVSPQQLSPAQQHKETRVEACRLCPLNFTGGYKPALAASWLHSVVWFRANCCFRRNTEMLSCAILHVKAWSCHCTLTEKKICKNTSPFSHLSEWCRRASCSTWHWRKRGQEGGTVRSRDSHAQISAGSRAGRDRDAL